MARMGLNRRIEEITQEVLSMGSMAEEAVQRSVQSLKDQDMALAQEVVEGDERVDELEAAIEERCLQLIALQQPMAKDLRLIGSLLKTVTDLERMADYATNIAERALWIGTQPLIKPLIDIPRMAEMALMMVKESLDAFVRGDVALAEKVCRDDEPVDALYSALFEELVGFIRKGGDTQRALQAVSLLFAARYLERIADHATNIAERVIFVVTGERVPHQLKQGTSPGPPKGSPTSS
ncbi:MAG: phosphate signaling complex protein PhoU [Firmicutes bacterium]|nr:phosphate signaling complex protein PhoU [Bacillota bacterium]